MIKVLDGASISKVYVAEAIEMNALAGDMLGFVWIVIGVMIWGALTGLLIFHLKKEDLTERQFYQIGNDQDWNQEKSKNHGESKSDRGQVSSRNDSAQ